MNNITNVSAISHLTTEQLLTAQVYTESNVQQSILYPGPPPAIWIVTVVLAATIATLLAGACCVMAYKHEHNSYQRFLRLKGLQIDLDKYKLKSKATSEARATAIDEDKILVDRQRAIKYYYKQSVEDNDNVGPHTAAWRTLLSPRIFDGYSITGFALSKWVVRELLWYAMELVGLGDVEGIQQPGVVFKEFLHDTESDLYKDYGMMWRATVATAKVRL